MRQEFCRYALGKGQKLCDLLTDKDKTYRAVMLLGTVTDTQDSSGEVLEKKRYRIAYSRRGNCMYSEVCREL